MRLLSYSLLSDWPVENKRDVRAERAWGRRLEKAMRRKAMGVKPQQTVNIQQAELFWKYPFVRTLSSKREFSHRVARGRRPSPSS